MAERTGDSDMREGVPPIHGFYSPFDPDHCIQLQQRNGGRRRVEVGSLKYPWRQGVGINLETDRQCGDRAHAALYDLVNPERIGPKALVTKGVEPKGLLTLGEVGGGRLVGAVITTGQKGGQKD